MGSIPGSGRPPGGGHGNPLQCSCLENPRDRGALSQKVRHDWSDLARMPTIGYLKDTVQCLDQFLPGLFFFSLSCLSMQRLFACYRLQHILGRIILYPSFSSFSSIITFGTILVVTWHSWELKVGRLRSTYWTMSLEHAPPLHPQMSRCMTEGSLEVGSDATCHWVKRVSQAPALAASTWHGQGLVAVGMSLSSAGWLFSSGTRDFRVSSTDPERDSSGHLKADLWS